MFGNIKCAITGTYRFDLAAMIPALGRAGGAEEEYKSSSGRFCM